MVKTINFVIASHHTHTHKKDRADEAANNLYFPGTFNLADEQRQEHEHTLTDRGLMSEWASGERRARDWLPLENPMLTKP